MKKKILLTALAALVILLSFSACKKSSPSSHSSQVPDNEAAAYLLEYLEEMYPRRSFVFSEIMDVSDHYDDADEVWCIGIKNDQNDQYSLAVVYKVDGEWDMHFASTAERTCADEFN